VTSRIAAIVLVVVGLVATSVGLGLRVFLPDDDEGHHDGRLPSFALASTSGTDELTIDQDGDGPTVVVALERAGQTISDLDEVHGARLHVFAATTGLDRFVHVDPDVGPDGRSAPITLPADGTYRLVVQAAPAGGPDLLELGADVTVSGTDGAGTDGAGTDGEAEQNITDDDVWTNGDVTVTRQGFDFVLSDPVDAPDHHGGPAFITLFRADDMAFVHGHAQLVEPDRFRFELAVPGRGDYLAALQFLPAADATEPVTALFRFSL